LKEKFDSSAPYNLIRPDKFFYPAFRVLGIIAETVFKALLTKNRHLTQFCSLQEWMLVTMQVAMTYLAYVEMKWQFDSVISFQSQIEDVARMFGKIALPIQFKEWFDDIARHTIDGRNFYPRTVDYNDNGSPANPNYLSHLPHFGWLYRQIRLHIEEDEGDELFPDDVDEYCTPGIVQDLLERHRAHEDDPPIDNWPNTYRGKIKFSLPIKRKFEAVIDELRRRDPDLVFDVDFTVHRQPVSTDQLITFTHGDEVTKVQLEYVHTFTGRDARHAMNTGTIYRLSHDDMAFGDFVHANTYYNLTDAQLRDHRDLVFHETFGWQQYTWRTLTERIAMTR